ncbi:9131_t:CDS:1, partial [Cetraspora pellucida]
KGQQTVSTYVKVPNAEAGSSKQDPIIEDPNWEEVTNENIESESKGKKLKKSQESSDEEIFSTSSNIQKEIPNIVQPK